MSDLMKLEFYRQIFEKCSNMKFHENPSNGSRVVPCSQTDRQTDGRTDMTKLRAAFRSFVNAPRVPPQPAPWFLQLLL